eukprot:jgi/Orpsp1_1/1190077/evm.model.d7180000076461.1
MNILSSICYKKYYEDDYINKTYFDKDIIRFILNNGFRQNEIDSHLINSLVILNNNKDNELEYIFKHFTYNNSMILKLVFINKNKKSISNLELDSLIVQLKKVVVIEESVYKFLISRGKYHTINTLFIYDKSTKDIMLNKIFKFNLINIALQHNEKNFLKNILNYESLDIQSIGFESIIINGIHNYYNSKILKFFTELLKQKHYNFEIVNFENILLEINKNFKEIDINFIKVLIELTMKINNFELIKLLMEHKELKYVDIINTKDKNDEYPIIVAYYSSKYYAKKSPYKCYQIFEYLLKQGAKINAIQKNNIDTVKEYIKKQNFTNSICNFNFNILTFSYLTNKKNIFNFLINENEKMFQISDSNNFYLLQYAILKEDIDMIYQIIKLNNENCIKYIKYLLDMSIEIGNKKIFYILLNCKNINFNEKNKYGESPIMTIIKSPYFSFEDKKEMILTLFEKNFFDPTKDYKYCLFLLNYAIKENQISIVKFLIENGVETEAKNSEEISALCCAIYFKSIPIVKILLDKGAS